MMRTLVILLVLLLLPGEVMADGAAWHKRHVVVRDYLPQARKADLEAMVTAFNAVMPRNAPRLVYVAMPETSCLRARTRDGIAVCQNARLADAETTYRQSGREILSAKIALPIDSNPLCHELMHALSDIPDDYTRPHEYESCVQGTTDTPGAFDVQFLRWAYKKFGRGH